MEEFLAELVILDKLILNMLLLKMIIQILNYRYDNVITLRTFSKAYGLAGLRVGYGFAMKHISNLMKVKLPFEPSIPALQ